jgi:hypothetical protein
MEGLCLPTEGYVHTLSRERKSRQKNLIPPPDFRITTATFCGLYVHFAADVHGETDWENVKTRHSPSVDGQRVHTIHGSVPFVESNWFERISVHGR